MLPELEEELLTLEEKLEKAVNHLSGEYVTVRAGRANPRILDNITVDYYGSLTPLRQMANITVPEPRMLVINLFDRSAAKETVKAIAASDIGINPTDDGKVIRLVFPHPLGPVKTTNSPSAISRSMPFSVGAGCDG